MTEFKLKRIQETPDVDDGRRVLVDRLWPRGISKQAARLDEWCKDVAPSTQLRKWFGHDPQRFAEFSHRYREELATSGAATEFSARMAGYQTVTLLIAARDQQHNHGLVLLAVLRELA